MALFQQDPDRENAKDGGKLQPRFRLSLYTIAGAYLLYLAYSLFKGYPDITDSRTRMLSLMGAVLFVVVGVLILIRFTVPLLTGHYEGGPKDPEVIEANRQAEAERKADQEKGPHALARRFDNSAAAEEDEKVPEES